MTLSNQISDKIILKGVTQKLAQRSAGSGNHVSATVRGGDVTLAGTLEHEHQRRVIIKTVSAVTGVRRVNDQLQVVTKKRN